MNSCSLAFYENSLCYYRMETVDGGSLDNHLLIDRKYLEVKGAVFQVEEEVREGEVEEVHHLVEEELVQEVFEVFLWMRFLPLNEEMEFEYSMKEEIE